MCFVLKKVPSDVCLKANIVFVFQSKYHYCSWLEKKAALHTGTTQSYFIRLLFTLGMSCVRPKSPVYICRIEYLCPINSLYSYFFFSGCHMKIILSSSIICCLKLVLKWFCFKPDRWRMISHVALPALKIIDLEEAQFSSTLVLL